MGQIDQGHRLTFTVYVRKVNCLVELLLCIDMFSYRLGEKLKIEGDTTFTKETQNVWSESTASEETREQLSVPQFIEFNL